MKLLLAIGYDPAKEKECEVKIMDKPESRKEKANQ